MREVEVASAIAAVRTHACLKWESSGFMCTTVGHGLVVRERGCKLSGFFSQVFLIDGRAWFVLA